MLQDLALEARRVAPLEDPVAVQVNKFGDRRECIQGISQVVVIALLQRPVVNVDDIERHAVDLGVKGQQSLDLVKPTPLIQP